MLQVSLFFWSKNHAWTRSVLNLLYAAWKMLTHLTFLIFCTLITFKSNNENNNDNHWISLSLTLYALLSIFFHISRILLCFVQCMRMKCHSTETLTFACDNKLIRMDITSSFYCFVWLGSESHVIIILQFLIYINKKWKWHSPHFVTHWCTAHVLSLAVAYNIDGFIENRTLFVCKNPPNR